jgi:hypothetical protein
VKAQDRVHEQERSHCQEDHEFPEKEGDAGRELMTKRRIVCLVQDRAASKQEVVSLVQREQGGAIDGWYICVKTYADLAVSNG